jgi:hypothetical protein
VLAKDLRNSVMPAPDSFAVLGASGDVVAKGRFGERVTLPEGKYSFRTSFDEQPFAQDFWINTDRSTSITFNAANLPRGATTTAPPREGPPAAAAKRFCTKCGAELPPGAKFCTSCGAKVD